MRPSGSVIGLEGVVSWKPDVTLAVTPSVVASSVFQSWTVSTSSMTRSSAASAAYWPSMLSR